jgi:hypothetical protein
MHISAHGNLVNQDTEQIVKLWTVAKIIWEKSGVQEHIFWTVKEENAERTEQRKKEDIKHWWCAHSNIQVQIGAIISFQ